MILILTDGQTDLHGRLVAEELTRRGIGSVFLNPPDVEMRSVCLSVSEGRRALRIGRDAEQVLASDIDAVLYRRPAPIPARETVDEEYREIVRDEWTAFVAGFYEMLARRARWVSPPWSIRRAESKIKQLDAAGEAGFLVPDTLVTNDLSAVGDFFASHPDGIVFKKLQTHCLINPERGALFVTRELPSLDVLDADALALCPMVFQAKVEKRCDLRVVVVGDRVIGVTIDSQAADASRVDYRAIAFGLRDLAHAVHEVPDDVADACRRMLAAFDLSFGAFDFAIDRDGRHWFLELNPNGQWLWLQLTTGVDIVGAMCDLLTGAAAPAAVA